MLPQITDNNDLTKFYEITISVSGVLFPIFQAVLFFIVEKSFNRLESSRQLLVNFYHKTGKIITLCLIYLLLQSTFQVIKFETFSLWFLHIFTFLIIIFHLDLLKYSGYYNTLNSSHYIPEKYNKLRKYIITLWNNTFLEKVRFLVFLIIIYLPFTQNNSIFWSVFSILIYTLFQISILFNNPTFIQKELLKSENINHELTDETLKWEKSKIDLELQIITQTLTVNNYKNEKEESLKNDYFEYFINPFVKENGELHLNIMIKNIKINSVEELKEQIYIISKNLFLLLAKTTTDINSFVLSFHFDLDKSRKNIFIRSNKIDILENKLKQPKEFVKSLKNRLIDDILK